jgi:hypothetical protein
MVQLMRENALREPLIVVSPWFETRRDGYQDGLLRVSASGEWEPWVRFFAEGIRASAEAACFRLERLLALEIEFADRVRASKRGGAAERVASELIENSYPTAPRIAAQHHVTQAGAPWPSGTSGRQRG